MPLLNKLTTTVSLKTKLLADNAYMQGTEPKIFNRVKFKICSSLPTGKKIRNMNVSQLCSNFDMFYLKFGVRQLQSVHIKATGAACSLKH